MRFSERIHHEWKTRLSRPAVLICLIFYGTAMFYGSLSGAKARDERLHAVETLFVEAREARAKFEANVRALEEKGVDSGVPSWAGSPMDITFPAVMQPGPLGDFSVGQSDILPFAGTLSLWNPDIRMFSKYELEDPVALALGAFDLSKVILLLMPLLLMVLCFDVLSSERDGKRLGLILAQGGRIRTIFWQGFFIRMAVVLALTLFMALVAIIFHRGSEPLSVRLAVFGWWLLGTFVYGIFWTALIGFIASRQRSGESHVMMLLLIWGGLTLILPACSVAIAESLYPSPSRLAYLAQTRSAENETTLAEADLANRFLLDHPELSVANENHFPDYFRTSFFVTTAVDRATRPLLLQFTQASEERERALRWLHFASPVMAVNHYFNSVAGTSGYHHHRYMAQARDFKAAYAERVKRIVIGGKRFPVSDLPNLPNFEFDKEPLPELVARFRYTCAFFIAVSAWFFWMADRRLNRTVGP